MGGSEFEILKDFVVSFFVLFISILVHGSSKRGWHLWGERRGEMRAAPLPPPVPAQRKAEEGKNGYTPRGPKRTKTNRLTEPTMEMLSAALQAHECIEENRCREDGVGFTTAEERVRQEESRRLNSMWVFISAMVGVVLAVVENELRWSADSSGRSSQGLSSALKGVVVGSTLVVCQIVDHF